MSLVIFKLKFNHPNLPETKSKNKAHLFYIATRPGVDKTLSEFDISKELNKECSDELTKFENKSHGLFGAKGIENIKEIAQEIENKKLVWKGTISLREQDANEIGFDSKDKWEMMIRKEINDIAQNMKIPVSNLRWVAAVHSVKGHPHLHFMLWEKKERLTKGEISQQALNNIRKKLTYEIFSDKYNDLIQQKNILRESMLEMSKSLAKKIAFEEKNQSKKTCPKLKRKIEKELIKMLDDLRKTLPEKGRINYKLMPLEFKKKVDNIVNLILEQTEFSSNMAKTKRIVEDMNHLYTDDKDVIEASLKKHYDDIHKRIANIILKSVKESKILSYVCYNDERMKRAADIIAGKNIDMCHLTIKEQEKHIKNIVKILLINRFEENEIMDILKNIKTYSSISMSEINKKMKELNKAENEEKRSLEYNKLKALKDKVAHGEPSVNDYNNIKIILNNEESYFENVIKNQKNYIEENEYWEKTIIISKSDWCKLFELYKGDYVDWGYSYIKSPAFTPYGINSSYLANNIWHAVWQSLSNIQHIERTRSNLHKDKSLSQRKAERKKLKSKSSLDVDNIL